MIGEFGESEIYETFTSGESLFETYCEEDCPAAQISARKAKFKEKLNTQADPDKYSPSASAGPARGLDDPPSTYTEL